MISYYNHSTDQIESRRSKLIESSWQTLTIMIAGAGLVYTLNTPIYFRVSVLLIFFVQILFAIVRLIEFQNQSGFKYPFNELKYSNKWKWFYYGNPYIADIGKDSTKKEKTRKKEKIAFLEGLDYFINKYSEETIDQEITDNLQQLFLLQFHNSYKNKFYLKLNEISIMANRITFLLTSVILGIYIGFLGFELFF